MGKARIAGLAAGKFLRAERQDLLKHVVRASTKGSHMTRACCPSCRLRFEGAAAAHLTNCPECGAPLQAPVAARDAIGYQLHGGWDSLSELPIALEAALLDPDWPAGR